MEISPRVRKFEFSAPRPSADSPLRVGTPEDLKFQSTKEQVTGSTVCCLRTIVLPAMPGIVCLSGGQTRVEATAHLAAMNAAGPHPWLLSFSYSQAIQKPVLETGRAYVANVAAAQAAFAERTWQNGPGKLKGMAS